MNSLDSVLILFLDIFLLFTVYPAACILKLIRKIGIHRLPKCRHMLLNIGVFPLIDHYYDPQFDHRNPTQPFCQDRNLPAIDWNVPEQLRILATFRLPGELQESAGKKVSGIPEFNFQNTTFSYGDADYWYQLVRTIKPTRIFEIGSGNSTLLARLAIDKNKQESPHYDCKHVCVEPYENPWLASAGVTLVREKVEQLGTGFFPSWKRTTSCLLTLLI